MMKKVFLFLFLIFLGCFFFQCEEPDTIINVYNEYNEYSRPMEFGETIYDLKSDTVYHATTDGLLYVDIKSFASPHNLEQINAKIYADSTKEPSRLVGTVFYSNTLPIKKDYYWNVMKLTSNGKLNISWTPIN
jgi:hypothetical protein